MIAASIILSCPTIPHHNRSQPPFHPHLISRVVDAAIEVNCSFQLGIGVVAEKSTSFAVRDISINAALQLNRQLYSASI
jgi:hypothetical protein